MEIDEIKRELRKLAPAFSERIAPVYKFLGWGWEPRGVMWGRMRHVPTAGEIERRLLDLIERLGETSVAWTSGGLEVYYELPDEEGDGKYGIRLTIDAVVTF